MIRGKRGRDRWRERASSGRRKRGHHAGRLDCRQRRRRKGGSTGPSSTRPTWKTRGTTCNTSKNIESVIWMGIDDSNAELFAHSYATSGPRRKTEGVSRWSSIPRSLLAYSTRDGQLIGIKRGRGNYWPTAQGPQRGARWKGQKGAPDSGFLRTKGRYPTSAPGNSKPQSHPRRKDQGEEGGTLRERGNPGNGGKEGPGGRGRRLGKEKRAKCDTTPTEFSDGSEPRTWNNKPTTRKLMTTHAGAK